MKKLISVFAALLGASLLQGAMVPFNLVGQAGGGLLPGNEVPSIVSPARGGEYNSGIIYDSVANELFLDVAWGSRYGFVDLTSGLREQAAGGVHIHAPATLNQNAGIVFFLGDTASRPSTITFENFDTAGRVFGSLILTEAQEQTLMAGLAYFNVHSDNFPSGELRANLVPIPEPATIGLIAAGALAGLLVLRRRRA